VRLTTTHAHYPPLGWSAFASVIANAGLPVYALGGIRMSDLARAMCHGAHGIASLSAVWDDDQCERLDASGVLSASFSSGPAIE